MYATDDLRIKWTKVVLPPVFLEEEMPMTDAASATVFQTRKAICNVLAGRDKRLIVVVGPCSIHDHDQGLVYAQRLAELRPKVEDVMLIVMPISTGLPVPTKKMVKGMTTMAVSSRAAPRRWVRQRMQLMTVMAM